VRNSGTDGTFSVFLSALEFPRPQPPPFAQISPSHFGTHPKIPDLFVDLSAPPTDHI